ncbi:MAG: hypothetical protein UZ14_CFX002003118 [Chloroflexi bacterium OLB14]|nr:MAG: hypothetical protein UZ14_CFX002003118 [Chloroflexi bacterium OLB14]
MAKKIDGIIEAARFKNGQIQFVRVYERRGFTFSDWKLLDRKTLVERLQKGKNFITGSREEFKASTFKTEKPVILVKENGNEYVATHHGAKQDSLENVPFF